jgi:hypothetical protein
MSAVCSTWRIQPVDATHWNCLGLLRLYLPKGIDISNSSQSKLNARGEAIERKAEKDAWLSNTRRDAQPICCIDRLNPHFEPVSHAK